MQTAYQFFRMKSAAVVHLRCHSYSSYAAKAFRNAMLPRHVQLQGAVNNNTQPRQTQCIFMRCTSEPMPVAVPWRPPQAPQPFQCPSRLGRLAWPLLSSLRLLPVHSQHCLIVVCMYAVDRHSCTEDLTRYWERGSACSVPNPKQVPA